MPAEHPPSSATRAFRAGEHLRRAWLNRGPLACLLWPLSLVYAALLQLRRLAYQLGWQHTRRLPVPVVVVGNVVVGGAGKTPTVAGLVEHLRRKGWTPGVISRGHGRSGEECTEVTVDSDSSLVGDEPMLIVRATGAPLVVGRRRYEAGLRLLALHPEVDIIISDDGMQHWALARDLTIVVFDARGVGNGWLLPAGMLREPWPARPWGQGTMLALLNSSDGVRPARLPDMPSHVPAFGALRTLADRSVAPDGRSRPLADFASPPAGMTVRALAGIAQPEAFFAMLQARGVKLDATLPLPDHAPGAQLLEAAQSGFTWLCTEKDAVKLFPVVSRKPGVDVWAVPLMMQASPGFYDAVDAALEGLSSAHGRQTP